MIYQCSPHQPPGMLFQVQKMSLLYNRRTAHRGPFRPKRTAPILGKSGNRATNAKRRKGTAMSKTGKMVPFEGNSLLKNGYRLKINTLLLTTVLLSTYFFNFHPQKHKWGKAFPIVNRSSTPVRSTLHSGCSSRQNA